MIEFTGLPGDFDFTSLVDYLESPEAHDLTHKYYSIEKRYFHEERGAGASAEDVILQLWDNIPDFIKEAFIIKIGELALSIPIKLIKDNKRRKVQKSEKAYLKRRYGFDTDTVEEIKIKNSEIIVKTYKRY